MSDGLTGRQHPDVTEPHDAATEEPSAVRVSPLELFFDLVFVLTIIQLTSALAHDLTWLGLAQVATMLGLLMWMYGGYAWLTNTIAPNNPGHRGVMIIGMAGFLVVSLGVPHAFGATGWAFGVGYFVGLWTP